jgi:hypothetical protein
MPKLIPVGATRWQFEVPAQAGTHFAGAGAVARSVPAGVYPRAGPVGRDPIAVRLRGYDVQADPVVATEQFRVPAQAGTHSASTRAVVRWVPAFAGTI